MLRRLAKGASLLQQWVGLDKVQCPQEMPRLLFEFLAFVHGVLLYVFPHKCSNKRTDTEVRLELSSIRVDFNAGVKGR